MCQTARRIAFFCFLLFLSLVSNLVQAQTFTVLHNFTGGADGFDPVGISVGPSGVLYGNAQFGGGHGAGTIFKLNQVNSSWVFSPLYEFTGGSDGYMPSGGVIVGPNDALYGTTSFGGTQGFGVVFELRPPPNSCGSALCYWNETVLHSFAGPPDGGIPGWANLAFDRAGNIYGTTPSGGALDYGIVFELTPSGDGYTENIIQNFGYGPGGSYPNSGVALDSAGNVYGTTTAGGTGTGYGCTNYCGTVYQLVPSGGNWTENVLVNFDATNGEAPYFSPIVDASGNVYGPANIIYKLTPSGGGGFNFSVISNLNQMFCGYQSPLVEDAAGNFYGTCQNGPSDTDYSGWIFELTNCSQTCTVVDLHQFNGTTDGSAPLGRISMDANGNLYGTTVAGGTGGNGCNNGGCGVVWELTP